MQTNSETYRTAKATYAVYEGLKEAKGVTDYEVAKSADIPTATISEWKQGQYTPKLEKLLKIAVYFDVPLEYFVVRKEES